MPSPAIRRVALAVCLVTLVLARPAAEQAADYDIVIRGGRVLDGMGNPWVLADVAIDGGRFAQRSAASPGVDAWKLTRADAMSLPAGST